MKEYYLQPEKTAEVFTEDGYLRTGDQGSIDADGYIKITGRLKEIFKTSTGEYVNAVAIEQKLSKNRYIEFAVVISQNRKYTTALLFVDIEKYEIAKKSNKSLTIEEYYNSSDIIKNISNYIENINKDLNQWEKIVNFKIITNDISIEGGELTPSMKICRNVIEEKYEEIINSMY